VTRRSPGPRQGARSCRAAAPDLSAYRLTIRRGSEVSREKFDRLGDAVEAMRVEVDEVIAEGPVPARKLIRDYEPETQVAARFEISSGGIFGGDTAGIDVMGDGRLVVFRGGMVRKELEPKGNQTPFDAVRKALR
jgi:hypothetical protein